MKRINQFEVLKLGNALGRLPDHAGPLPEMFDSVSVALSLLNPARSGETMDLGRAEPRADQLVALLFGFYQRHYSQPTDEQPSPASYEQEWRLIAQTRDAFFISFQDAMADAATYQAASAGVFNMELLVDRADLMFTESERAKMSDNARQDWCQAGRCLAFDLNTASAFHVSRAVELTMDAYAAPYLNGKKAKNWGDYAAALKPAADEAPLGRHALIHGKFDHMRRHDRNLFIHPRIDIERGKALAFLSDGHCLISLMLSTD